MKKVFIYTTVGVMLAILGVYTTSNIYAEDGSVAARFPFISELAEKLNMDEVELEEIVTEIQESHRAEMQAERTETILQGIEEGKLSERQATILDAMEDLRPMEEKGMFGAEKGLTQEEREALREQFRAERGDNMLDALNEKGLNVTVEELQELREIREELGLMGNQYRRSNDGELRGSGECINE